MISFGIHQSLINLDSGRKDILLKPIYEKGAFLDLDFLRIFNPWIGTNVYTSKIPCAIGMKMRQRISDSIVSNS
jgi:hypothetical protein